MKHRIALASIILAAAVIAGAILFSSAEKSPPDDMVLIPAGEFLMGSDRVDTEGKSVEFGFAKPLYLDEHPLQRISLPDYYIDRTEVTQKAYREFVKKTGAPSPKHWKEGKPDPADEMLPVTWVDWFQAQRYCEWRGKRLPTEAEWEKAARGTDGREFPWGNEFEGQKANTADAKRGGLAPVGSFPESRSPTGVDDLTGNAWEWTLDWYMPYPNSPHHSEHFGRKFKVVRGGSWGGQGGHYFLPEFYRIAYRFPAPPVARFADFGFRCVKPLAAPS